MSQIRNGVDGNGAAQFEHEGARHRLRTQETARELSVVALRQWEKALGGLLALPAATAASTAAGVLHVAAFFEGAFELVESSLIDIGRRIEHDATTGETIALRGREERRDLVDRAS
jgi:hypothetical protein